MITLYVRPGIPISSSQIDEVLQKNLANPLIDRIVLFCSPNQDVPPLGSKISVNCLFDNGPTFREYFDYINTQTTSPYDIHIIAKAEVSFEESLLLVVDAHLENT